MSLFFAKKGASETESIKSLNADQIKIFSKALKLLDFKFTVRFNGHLDWASKFFR